jgi:hypothetical protein
MRSPVRVVATRFARRHEAVGPGRMDAGDTLIEILLSLVVLGVAALSIMLALLTSISGSAEYRGLASMDTVLRSAAGEVTTQVQAEPESYWAACTQPSSVVTFTLPNGYTAVIAPASWWSVSTSTYTKTCAANESELISITVTNTKTGLSSVISTVLYDPQALPVPSAACSGAYQLVFIGQPTGGIVTTTLAPPPIVAIECPATGNIISSDLTPISLAISAGTGTTGAALSSNCMGNGFYGVITFANCSINMVGTGYTLLASNSSAGSATSSAFNISALLASKFTVISPTVTGAASTSASIGPITIQEQDQLGNPVNAGAGGDEVDLATSSSGTAVFSATAGGPPVTFVTILAGSSTASFFYGDTLAGTPTLTGSEPGMAPGSQVETVTAGAPGSIAFAPTIPGPGKVNTALPNVAVAVEDSFGNVVTAQSTGTVTLAIASGSPQASFTSGTTTVGITNGVATFTNLIVDKSGIYTFTATPTGVTGVAGSVNSGAFSVLAGAVTKDVFTTAAFVTTSSSSATQPFTVALEDSLGNFATSATATTLNLTSTSAGRLFATSSGGASTTSVVIPAGSSTATIYYGDTVVGTPTLTVSSTGLMNITQTEKVSATKLIITTAPFTDPTNGSPTQAVTVQMQLGSGVATTSATATTITLASTSSGAIFATSTGGASVTTVTLLANTSSVTFYYGDTKVGSPTITTSATNATNGTQSETVVAGPGTHLIFTTSSFSTPASIPPGQPFTVTLEDAYGNATTSASATTITLASSSVAGSFAATAGGTTVTSVVLASNTSSITAYYGDTVTGTPTLTASAPGLTSGTQVETVTAGSGSHLVFTTPPASSYAAGASIAVSVSVEDGFGNVVTGSTDTVSLALSTGSFAAGTTSVAEINGTANFTGLKITTAGTYTITANDTTNAAVNSATTSSFAVTSAAANKLVITTGAINATANSAATQALTITLEDTYGNAATNAAATTINLSSSSAGASFASLSGGTAITSIVLPANTSSVSLFYGDTKAGSPTITVSATALTNGTQVETIVASAAFKLVITSSALNFVATNSPTKQFTVTLEDAYGNLATNATATTLNLSSTSGAGVFALLSGGGSVLTASLPANTSTLNLFYGDSKAGSPTITVASSGLTSGSQSETVTAGTPAKFAITSGTFNDPASGTATQAVTVALEDTYGNITTRSTATTVTLASSSSGALFASSPGGSSIGTTSIPANNSSVTVYYADTKAGTPTLTASGGFTSGTQADTITALAGTNLAISSSAFTATVSTSATTAFTVTLEDIYGNATTSATATTVSLSSSSAAGIFATSPNGSSALTVTLPANTSSVLAYYADTKSGAPTLTVAGSSLTSGTQVETMKAGAGYQLVITSATMHFTHGSFANQPFTVTLEDFYGNITTSASAITVNLSSTGGGKFASFSDGFTVTNVSLPANNSSVIAYYTDTTAGTPTITVAATGLTSGTQVETVS